MCVHFGRIWALTPDTVTGPLALLIVYASGVGLVRGVGPGGAGASPSASGSHNGGGAGRSADLPARLVWQVGVFNTKLEDVYVCM